MSTVKKSSFKMQPLTLGALTIALLATAASFWRSSSRSELESDLKAKESESTRFADNVRYGQKLDAQFKSLVDLNKQASERLTDPTDLAANQQYFYKLEATSGVKISDLRQVSIPKKKGAAVTLYTPVPYFITVSGNFPQVLGFIRNIESGSKICRITTASIVAASIKDSSSSTLTLNITAEFVGSL